MNRILFTIFSTVTDENTTEIMLNLTYMFYLYGYAYAYIKIVMLYTNKLLCKLKSFLEKFSQNWVINFNLMHTRTHPCAH